jgi:hypothetical protein
MVGDEKGSNTGSSSGSFHLRGEVGEIGPRNCGLDVSASSIESAGVKLVDVSDSSLSGNDVLREFR